MAYTERSSPQPALIYLITTQKFTTMVTMKFEAEKLNGEILALPCVLVTINNKKNRMDISLGWLKGVLTIGIEWSRKVVKVQAQ